MSGIAVIAFGCFAFAVGIVAALALSSLAWPRIADLGRPVLAVTAAIGLAGLSARSVASGHLPIFGTFENTYTAAWFLVTAAVVVSYRTPAVRFWRVLAPWPLALLLYGARFRHEIVPLTISEQSLWVDIHVAFAWLAFTAFAIATTLSVVRISGRTVAGYDDGDLETAHQRMMLLGYLNFTATLAFGSWYLYVLFGTFWRWEIVETFSLIAWVLYAMLIHGRLFYGWSGRAYHAAVVAVLPVLLLAYWVWSVFPGTFHFFDIPLMRPY